MIRQSLLATAAAAALALGAFAIGGCQSSGHAEASVDANRPAMASETTRTETTYSSNPPASARTVPAPDQPAPPPDVTVTTPAQPASGSQGITVETTGAAAASSYTVAYTVASDTPYMRTATDTASAGTLRSGDTVYLQSGAPTSGIVPAKTADGKIVYVRASDLRAK